jgi:hypothetical protein
MLLAVNLIRMLPRGRLMKKGNKTLPNSKELIKEEEEGINNRTSNNTITWEEAVIPKTLLKLQEPPEEGSKEATSSI